MAIGDIGLLSVIFDVSKRLDRKVFHANENDYNGRGLQITIRNNGAIVDCTGVTVRFGYIGTDGIAKGVNFTAVDATNGVFKVHYPTDMIRNNGGMIVKCTITATDAMSEISFENIFIYVNQAEVDDSTMEANSEFSSLQLAINEATAAKNGYIADAASLETTYVPRLTTVETDLAEIIHKQDWYDAYEKLKVKNNDAVMLKKVSDTLMEVYIHHNKNNYQQWLLTRSDGLDNAVANHANGNPWQINSVKNILVGTEDKVLSSDAAMTKSGSWTNYSGTYVATTTGAYLETTVFGGDIIVYGTFKNDGGIASLLIDGVAYDPVDFYDPSTGGVAKAKLIASGLSEADHVVRLTVSGTKNASSGGYAVRVAYISGTSKVELSATESTALSGILVPMLSGRNYRYGQSAIELAINNTFGGNTVWSGTYHKNLYPAVADGQKIYLDGLEKSFASMVVGTYYICKDIMIVQDLKLANGATAIADVLLIEHFTKDGYHVKWNLEWTQIVTINTSYSAMWGTSIDRLIFGDTQNINVATYDDAEHGDVDTFNMIGWQSQDNYLVGFKALNPVAMAFVNTPKGMYYRDRTTDMKMYLYRFAGNVAVGDKWQSEFIVSIAKCNNVNLVMAS